MMSSFDWNWQSDFRSLHGFAVCVWVCACVFVPQRAFHAERGHMQGYKIGFRCVLKTHQEPAVPERALPLNGNVSHKPYEMPRRCLPEHTMHLMWEDICSTCNKHRKKPRSAGKLQCLGGYSILQLLTSVGTLWFWPSEWNCSHAKLMIPADFTFRGGNWDLNVQKWQYSPAAHANKHLAINPNS